MTIKGKGNFKGKKTVKFQVVPKGTKLTSLKCGAKKISLKWKKQKKISGYQIRYATKKDFSDAKTITIKKARATKRVIRKLQPGTKYYVQIRTIKTVKKQTYASAWSKVKSIKTKGKAKKVANPEPTPNDEPEETFANLGEEILPDVETIDGSVMELTLE